MGFKLTLIVILIHLSLATTYTQTLSFSSSNTIVTRSYSISAVQNTYVSINLTKVTPNISYTAMYAALVNVSFVQPPIPSYYGKNLQFFANMDYEGLAMGKSQIVNIRVTNTSQNTMYLYFFNYDANPSSMQFEVTINDGLASKACQNCANLGILDSSNCTCSNCISGFEGYDCSRYVKVIPSSGDSLVVPVNGIAYAKIEQQDTDIKISIRIFDTNPIEIYARYIRTQGQFANYFNVAVGDTQARWGLGGNVTSMSATASPQTGPVSLTFAKYSGPGSASTVYISYQKINGIAIITIVLIILGCIIGIALIAGIVFLIYRLKTNQTRIYDTNVLQVAADKLSAQQIEKYFPEFTRSLLSQEQPSVQSIQSKQQTVDKQCAICLSAIEVEQKARITFCKHMFHSACLISWFKKQRNCPYCRQEYSKQVTIQLYMDLFNSNGKTVLKGMTLVKAIINSQKKNGVGISTVSKNTVVENIQ